ncbi:hypothetical protein PanWU01x14_347960 [Parasponia andersonii]|uniref:Uncharacterized protein n=1 Tax=Parasponia andersonii TaxID=3476 RepID=A0A2P5ABV2_PARAD|nr:hypothetical protein PanWU01x14_347960 [Parasponia andersonii]
MELCLVGKILGNKVANPEGLRRTMKSVLRLPSSFHSESMDSPNIFIFFFGLKTDRQRILAGRPWFCENQLLSLIKPRGIGDFSAMDFNMVSFWIQIVKAPVSCIIRIVHVFWVPKLDFWRMWKSLVAVCVSV